MKGWKGSSWSFPRGKKSKDEEDYACAIREVCVDYVAFLLPLTWFICVVCFVTNLIAPAPTRLSLLHIVN